MYVHYTSISRSSTISQTWTSVFQIQIAVLCGNCPKLAHVKLIQFHRDDFSKMWPVQKVWRGFSHQLAVFNRNFGTPPTSTTLPKEGMSSAIHNKNQSNSLFINPSLIALRGNVCKVSFCLEWSANFTNLLNVVRAQNLCFFASTDAVVFDSKNWNFFLLCSPLMDQGLVTLFTHLTRSIFQN